LQILREINSILKSLLTDSLLISHVESSYVTFCSKFCKQRGWFNESQTCHSNHRYKTCGQLGPWSLHFEEQSGFRKLLANADVLVAVVGKTVDSFFFLFTFLFN